MSGHSKWASIKHKKGANDAKRGKLFTKVIMEITVAARMGGGDEAANPRLRAALLRAKSANMPKDNVDRAIKKGTGDLDGVNYEELTYEAYGPKGVAILINCLTDNRNRTAADVRSILTKGGGNMGEAGCVSYLFQRKGVIAIDSSVYTEDQVFEVALEAGAEDVTSGDGQIEVVTEPETFEAVIQSLESAGIEHTFAEVSQVPDATIALDQDGTRKALRLIDRLDDSDDVQSVFSNIDIPDDFELEDE
ncbi:MAG: YebC/PmpR family DNA-binding transcriptional regulator [Spirochaetales bacterium]|jgi:YebC/PmpR family DNA-binding regulatory protein|nr:YebC/PmpR family DNA-binding transcriptional regulator [Spirochaetales bacterium]